MSSRPVARPLPWGAVVAVPFVLLAFDPWGWTPFGPLKWAIVTVATLAGLAALSMLDIEVERTTLAAWGALLVWLALVASIGVDPFHGWLGTPERHLGVIAWILFAACFVLGQRTDAVAVARSLVVALLGVDAYSLAEAFDHAPVSVALGSRLGGPFGSAAYLGAACVMLLPPAIGIAVARGQPRGWRTAAAVAAVLGAIPFIGSLTRAAWVGGVAAVGFALARLPPRRWAAVGAGLVVVVGVALLAPGVRERLADGGGSRVDEWRVGARALVDAPLFGNGPEGYRIAFPTVVDDDYVRRYGRSVVTDRAHNGLLDMGVASGFPGVAIYVGLLALVARRLWASVRHGEAVLAALAVGVLAYGVQQQLLFPVVEIDPVMWLMAGAVVATSSRSIVVTRGRARSFALSTAAVGFAVVGVLDLVADHDTKQALHAVLVGRLPRALELADRAHALRPDSMRYDLVAAVVAAQPATLPALDAGLLRIDRALVLSPRDPLLRLRRAQWLSGRAELTGKPADVASALETWRSVARTDPRNPAVLQGLTAAEALANGDA
ncbi:MAG: O-antigen ligase family protein [Acidimicrobiales bacterium]